MALIIKRLSPLKPKGLPPEPLYSTLIRSVLKPVHPLFDFQIERMDIKTTVDFKISLRQLRVDGLEATPGRPFLFGTFPGFWFDRLVASRDDFEIAQQFKHFEQYAFKCLARFLDEVLAHETKGQRNSLVLYSNKIEWPTVIRYFELLTEPLYMFDRYTGDGDGNLNLVLNPKPWQDPTGLARSIYAINAGGFCKSQLETEVSATAKEKGRDFANTRLKEYLLNLLTDALYGARWKS